MLGFLPSFYLKVKKLNFRPEIALRLKKTQTHVVGSPTPWKIPWPPTERVILHSLSLLLRVMIRI